MSTEHEPDWMRDKRLRDEEARMVRFEGDVKAIRVQTDAIRALFDEERKARRAAEAALADHEKSDNQKFASIDSRLQGAQTQLSTITETLTRIESTVRAAEPRLKALEDENTERSAVGRFIHSAWAQFLAGAALVSTLVGIYLAVT